MNVTARRAAAGLGSVVVSALLLAVSVVAPAQAATSTPSTGCAAGTLVMTPTIAIDSGGQGGRFDGRSWVSDRYVTGISTSWTNTSRYSKDVANTSADALYSSWRTGGNFGYSIPVANGRYLVRVHLAEIYWGARGGKATNVGPGKRVQNINIEGGGVEVQGLAVGAEAGAPLRAYTLGYETQVRDRFLTLDFQRVVDNAAVNGIEVIRLTSCS